MSMNELHLSDKVFSERIPDLSAARLWRRRGYAQLEVDDEHPLYYDPVVSLADYGVKSRSYYSRKNVTGDPIPGVKPDVMVRRDVAERLARINMFLTDAEFAKKHFGIAVELFVDEGIRSVALQQKVHDEVYPDFLRRTHTDWTETQVLEERDRRIAPGSPSSPHAAGAIDLKLINAESGEVDTRASYGLTRSKPLALQPDYYETSGQPGDEMFLGVRRFMWGVMHTAGFENNPEEIFHWGTGDRLAALIGDYQPYYDAVPGMPEWDLSAIEA